MLVIICADNSDHSKYALDFYLKTLHKPGNTVKVLHCQEDWRNVGVMEGPTPGTVHKLQAEGKENAQQCQEHAQNVCRNKYHVEHEFIREFTNDPWETIVKMADSQGAGMIVLGSRGLGKLRRTLLGSCSTSVVHHAHCPVLVCSPPDQQQ